MPGTNGLDLLRELRVDPETAGIKVIMTSGWPPIAEEAPKAGAQGYLAIPVRFGESGEKVSSCWVLWFSGRRVKLTRRAQA